VGPVLIEQGIVDSVSYERENQQFYDDYRAGTLDIQEFLAFMLRPLAEHSLEQLLAWRAQFIEDKIRPILLPKAMELLARHRRGRHPADHHRHQPFPHCAHRRIAGGAAPAGDEVEFTAGAIPVAQ
jgi:hypothetical protein